jgi:hypothetical protein
MGELNVSGNNRHNHNWKIQRQVQHLATRHGTKKKNTQKTKKLSYADPTQNRRGGVTHDRQFLLFYKIPAMLFIVKSGQLLLMIEERKVYLKEKKKIHCRLRNWYFVTVNQFMLTAM